MDEGGALDACERGAASRPDQQREDAVLERSSTDPVVSRSCFEPQEPRAWSSESGAPGPPLDLRRKCWHRAFTEEQRDVLAQTLVLTLGSVPVRVPTQTFLCRICLENVPVADRLIMAHCGRAGHATCNDCLRTYFRLRVEEARVDELHCPCAGSDGCDAQATEEELRTWLGEEVFEKFQRFSRMRADPKLRACPECCMLCSPEVAEDGHVIAEMVCGACHCAFCYHHSNAHPPGAAACAEYERRVVKRQLLELMDAGLGTKSCPRCGFATERSSGCNHMTCRCKADWCWVCGQELTNVGWHYNPANPNGCMQFQEELSSRHDGRLMVLCKFLCLPVVAISVLFVFCFALVLLVLLPVPALMRFREVGFKAWIGIAIAIVGGPFTVFCLVWGAVGFVLWTVLLPCGVGEVHAHFIVGVPFMTVLAVGEGIMGRGRPGRQQGQ